MTDATATMIGGVFGGLFMLVFILACTGFISEWLSIWASRKRCVHSSEPKFRVVEPERKDDGAVSTTGA
jgi:hypothetical protein